MEWSLGVEPWSAVLEWTLEWNEVKFGVILALLGQDLVQIDQLLVNAYFKVHFALDSLCVFLPCVAHMLQTSFEYLFHNR